MPLHSTPPLLCSYQDGARPAGALQGYAAQKALAGLPSPLEYLSYLFAAGNLLAGPFYEARDFLDYVRRQVRGCGCTVCCGWAGAPQPGRC